MAEKEPLYAVYNDKGKRLMYTDDIKSVDSQERIESILSAGNKVKINGKNLAKSKISSTLKEIKK